MAIDGYTSVTLPDVLVYRIDKFFIKTDKEYNSRAKIVEKAMTLLEKQRDR